MIARWNYGTYRPGHRYWGNPIEARLVAFTTLVSQPSGDADVFRGTLRNKRALGATLRTKRVQSYVLEQ